ncbi:MAG: FAD-dependent oxidoreductase [Gemmatimonadales bacterium]
MQRDLSRLSGTEHDVVVVGGGIHGACVAWDATLRGLRVALVEREDFGGATSANSLRIVHGGLRYLARGDFRRMRESIEERSAFLRIAPTLVEPLAVLVPTRGLGTQSRPALGTALALNDLLSLDRNRGLDAAHRLSRGGLLSTARCRQLFPSFPDEGVSGGALWHDARMRHPERLTLAFVRAAADRGAVAANYCGMERLLHDGGVARGVVAADLLGGGTLEVRGRTVVVAGGPWTGALATDGAIRPQAFALNLVIGRRLAEVAVGMRALTGAEEDPVIGGRRFIFLVPQDETTFLGTWYATAEGRTPAELVRLGEAALLSEFQAACPALELDAADVVRSQWGWLPLRTGRERGRATALADRPVVIDHGATAGLGGMFSVEGVKYTTARRVAADVVDRVVARLNAVTDRCRTDQVRVDEGEGTGDASLDGRVRRAVREEMAVRLSDVVLRRIGAGAPPKPAAATVVSAAEIAGQELGWTRERQDTEIEDVMQQVRTVGPIGEPRA